MNLALGDLGYELLLVPNFTVAGDCRKGRRPSFDRAAEPDKAEWLLQRLGEMLESEKIKVSWGAFGSKMEVSVENDGPVTLLIDSGKRL
jgi:D-tyrosyl-tRNA(Tyr) deacylase